MPVNATVNGTSYQIPQGTETGWSSLTNFLLALSQHTLQKTGGAFTLTAELDLGPAYGVKASYLKSRAADAPAAGMVRLGNADSIVWRNVANSANLPLSVAADKLQFNAVELVDLSSTQTLTNKTISAAANTITGIAAAQISKVATGNLSATDVEAALNELQGDVDTINGKVGATSGIAQLDSSGKVPLAQIPATAISNVYAVANIAARDALTVQTGDVAKVTDAGGGVTKTYIYDGASWIELQSDGALQSHSASITGIHGVTGNLVGTSDAQTLTNKTVGGALLMAEIASPGTPASGKVAVFAKNDKNLYTLDSSGNEKAVGSGSGGGVKNYATGGDAESGVVGATYADGAAFPVDGQSGSPTATVTVSAVSPLSGTKSFIYTPGALGNGWAIPFTIDREDLAGGLQLNYSYEISGTGYVDGDLQWYFEYNDGTEHILQPSAYKIMNAIGPVKGQVVEVQAPYNTQNLKLLLHQTTATNTYAVKFEVSVGPKTKSMGAAMSDWQSYTPTYTNMGTVTTDNAEYKIFGDSMFLRGRFTVGVPVVANITISLPSGRSWSTPTTSSAQVGECETTEPTYFDLRLFTTSGVTSGSTLSFVNANAALGVPLNGFPNGTIFTWKAQVKLLGASSNSITSDMAAGGEIKARYTNSAATTLSNATVYFLDFPTKYNDSTGAVLGAGSGHNTTYTSTWRYVCPTPGSYFVAVTIATGSFTWGTSTVSEIRVYKNGVYYSTLDARHGTGAVANLRSSGSDEVDCIAGDVLSIGYIHTQGGNTNILSDNINTHVSISKSASPQQITAADTVSAKYTSSSTAALGSAVPVPSLTKVWDSHGAYNPAVGFTAPISGEYTATPNVAITGTTAVIAAAILFKGAIGVGVEQERSYVTFQANGNYHSFTPQFSFKALAGEVHWVGISGLTGSGSLGGFSSVTFRRVGNY